MKSVLMVFAVLALAAPALAGDGQVAQSDLAAVGLGQMSVLSDAQGMQVRGMSSSAEATGLLLGSGVLFDPSTGSSATASFSLFARGTAENAGLNQPSTALFGPLAGTITGQHATAFNGNTFAGAFAITGAGVGFAFGQ